MSGPIAGLLHFLGSEVGSALGRKVARDVHAAQQLLPDGSTWTHADKIAELAADSGLSLSYIKELIANSVKKADLQSLESYLRSGAQSGNLDPEQRAWLLHTVYDKLRAVEESELLKALLKAVKEHTLSWADSAADLTNYFC